MVDCNSVPQGTFLYEIQQEDVGQNAAMTLANIADGYGKEYSIISDLYRRQFPGSMPLEQQTIFAGQVIHIPNPPPENYALLEYADTPQGVLYPCEATDEEIRRQAQIDAAIEHVEEREADRSRVPAEPLTQEKINLLMAQLATSQQYAALIEQTSDPTALLSDVLLLPGETFNRQIAMNARRDWMIARLEARGEDTRGKSFSQLEDMMRQYIYSRALSRLASGTCDSVFFSQQRTPDQISLCEELGMLRANIGDYSLEEINNFVFRFQSVFPNTREQNFTVFNEYYNVVDAAQLEFLLENWDQETERTQLDALLEQIGLMPNIVLGVSVQWVKQSILAYYGQMEARHTMLAQLALPGQQAEQAQIERENAQRARYIDQLGEAVDHELIEENLLLWQTMDLAVLQEQAQEASHMIHGSYVDFFIDEFDFHRSYDGYDYNRHMLVTYSMFILSFVPVVGVVVDIIDIVMTIQQIQAGTISDEEAAFALSLNTLSLIGNLAGIGAIMNGLADTADNVAGSLRASRHMENLIEELRLANIALDEDIIGQIRQFAGELTDEILIYLPEDIRSWRQQSGGEGANPYIITSTFLSHPYYDAFFPMPVSGLPFNLREQVASTRYIIDLFNRHSLHQYGFTLDEIFQNINRDDFLEGVIDRLFDEGSIAEIVGADLSIAKSGCVAFCIAEALRISKGLEPLTGSQLYESMREIAASYPQLITGGGSGLTTLQMIEYLSNAGINASNIKATPDTLFDLVFESQDSIFSVSHRNGPNRSSVDFSGGATLDQINDVGGVGHRTLILGVGYFDFSDLNLPGRTFGYEQAYVVFDPNSTGWSIVPRVLFEENITFSYVLNDGTSAFNTVRIPVGAENIPGLDSVITGR